MSQKKSSRLRIGTVENYRHLWLLSIWVVYLSLFFVIEHVVTEDYWVSYMPLDDKIPFCEYFIIPYCLWHPLLAVMTAYLAFFDAENFKRYMAFIGIGFITTGIFCLLFPNGQDLRLTEFPRENLCTQFVRIIYAADTNTNVLPSMHAAARSLPRASTRRASESVICTGSCCRWVCSSASLRCSSSSTRSSILSWPCRLRF